MEIGIDLGSSNVRVGIKGQGVMLTEPSVVAFDKDIREIKGIGEEAELLLSRTPGSIVELHPLKQGVISDYTGTKQMIEYFLQKALHMHNKPLVKPVLTMSIPCGISEVEKMALEGAALGAGARLVRLVEEPIAAALGVGIPINKPIGNMIVDIGGGSTDIAVLSLGQIVEKKSVKRAGNDYDERIVRYLYEQHEVYVGWKSAEKLKNEIASMHPSEQPQSYSIYGRSIHDLISREVLLSNSELTPVIQATTEEIIDGISEVLEKTPVELLVDVYERGILFTGGGSRMAGLESLIKERFGIKAIIPLEPQRAVSIGLLRKEAN